MRTTTAMALAIAATGTVLGLDTAWAQQAPPSDKIQTITVTAEKRKENLTEVPLAVSVVSGAQLQEEHIQDIDDLSRQVPGLSFSNVGGEGLDKIELRGISSDSPQPTVGIYLDDVPMTMQNLVNTGAAQPKFFDIDRIEVLRGPQGTLYGAGSMGGTLRFISNQPNLTEYSGSAYTEVSGTDHGGINFEQNAVVNVPLIDGVAALRLGADYTEQSGWIDHYNSGVGPTDPYTGLPGGPVGAKDQSGVNESRIEVIRASLKVKLPDDWVITPSLFFQRSDNDDTDVFGQREQGDSVTPPEYGTDKLVKESSRDTLFVPSLTIDKDVGFGDVTSVTSYFWRMFPRVQDGTNYNSGLLGLILDSDAGTIAAFPKLYASGALPTAAYNAIANLPSHAYITPESDQLSEEIRLASKDAKDAGVPYTWTVGLYGADSHLHLSDQEFMNGMSGLLASIYGVPADKIPAIYAPTVTTPACPAGCPIPQPLSEQNINYAYAEEYGDDVKTYAVFGEFTYQIEDTLKATVGARYTYGRDSDHAFQGAYYTADAPPYAGSTTHSYAFTPKFALTWDYQPDSSLYANISKGFRLGGSNVPVPNASCAFDFKNLGISGIPENYGADSLWSYEAGTKSLFLDSRVSVNFSAYYIAWKDAQQHIYLPICGYDFDENAGNAQSYGAEAEIRGKVTPELTVTVTADYTHATLTSVDPTAQTTFHVGDKLLGTPDWSATLGAVYSRPLTDDIDGFVRGDWDWTGASHGSPSGIPSPDSQRPVYNVLNAATGVTMGDYEVSLFAKNLANNGKQIQHPSLLSVNEGFALMPLTIGVSLNVDF